MSETSKSDAELLRRTYQEEVMTSRSEDCPSDETLVALVLGELDDALRADVADHVVGCQHCAESFRVLGELQKQVSEAQNASIFRRRTWLALASAAALVIGIGTYAVVRDGGDPDVLRSTSGGGAVEPEDGAALGSPPSALSWGAETGATGYRVRLFAGDGTLVWESPETQESQVAVPPDAGVLSGESYFWTVTVEGPVRRSELGPFRFEVQ